MKKRRLLTKTWGGSRSDTRPLFFMFYRIFKGKKYAKIQKNEKKSKKNQKKFGHIKKKL